MRPLPLLDPLLSDEGWPHASAAPIEPGDAGRFHALFGRDALICSLELLPVRPDVARATLRALAARQGSAERIGTHEQPGKIGHEFRSRAPPAMAAAGWPDVGEFRYYGTADATAWFVVLLAALGEPALATELETAWRGAAEWLVRTLKRGGGLVRHGPGPWAGDLTQHGWRDVIEPGAPHELGGGIVRPDGTAPQPPLADADTQAVAYAALRALEMLDPGAPWAAHAAALRDRVESAFTADTIALEGDDRRVPGAGSQLGWLLWSGVLTGDARTCAAERLCAPDILTDHGLRTLSGASPVFEPHAYHRGSVWPFDSWLGCGGLRAAGRAHEAERVRVGVLNALEHLGQAPELYAVTRGGQLEPIAIANRVQAWTVGARWALEHHWHGRPKWLG